MSTVAMDLLAERIEELAAENEELKRIVDTYDEEEDFATRTARLLLDTIDTDMTALVSKDVMERLIILATTRINKPEEGEDVHYHVF